MYFCCVKILRKNTWLFITCVRKLIICYTVKSLFAEIHIIDGYAGFFLQGFKARYLKANT